MAGNAAADLGGTHSRALFVEGVFRDVVLPESRLAGTDLKARRRNFVIRTASASIALVLGVIGAVLVSASFATNRSLIADVSGSADRYLAAATKPVADTLADSAVLDRVEALGTVVSQSERYEPSPPLSAREFLYQGRMLSENAGDLYDRELASTVGRRLRASLERALQGDGADGQYAVHQFEWLKAYLMLDEAYASHRDKAYLRSIAGDVWGRELRAQPSLRDRWLAQLDAMLKREVHSQTLDPQLVDRIRQQIGRSDQELGQFIFRAMELQINVPGGKDLLLSDLLGNNGKRLFQLASGWSALSSVPALYTQPGANAFVSGLDAKLRAFCDDGWVLDRYMPARDLVLGDGVRMRVRKLYADRYIEKWEGVLRSVTPSGDFKTRLANRDGIRQFLRNVWPNIDLPIPAANDSAAGAPASGQTAMANPALDKVGDPRTLVNQHFQQLNEAIRGDGLNKLMANLDTIFLALQSLDLEASPGEVKLDAKGQLSTVDQMKSAQINMIAMQIVGQTSPGFVEPMSSWYNAIKLGADKFIVDKQKQNAQRTDAALEAQSKAGK
jgi:type VI protein secretion system component VasK